MGSLCYLQKNVLRQFWRQSPCKANPKAVSVLREHNGCTARLFSCPISTCIAASLQPTPTPSTTATVHHSFHMPFRCARVRLAAKALCVCVCARVRVSRCYLSGHHLRAVHSRSSESSYGQSNQPLHRNDLATQVPKSHCHCLDVHTVTQAHGRERGEERGRERM